MKRKLFISIMLVTVFLLGIYGCSSKSDISGIWKGTIDTTIKHWNGKVVKEKAPIELMIAQTDKNISGNIKVGSKSLAIDSGIIIDKKIVIKVSSFEIEATVNGKSIEGTMKGSFMGQDTGTYRLDGSFKTTKE